MKQSGIGNRSIILGAAISYAGLVSDFLMERALSASSGFLNPARWFGASRVASKTNNGSKRSGARRGDHYIKKGRLSTHGLTTERERRDVIRRIYTEGEARRKSLVRPDDRDDKYLHSHARAMRRLARQIGSEAA